MSRHDGLLRWQARRVKPRTAWDLADSLSVEAIGYAVPKRMLVALVAFRHLRDDARLAAARSFMAGTKPEQSRWVAK